MSECRHCRWEEDDHDEALASPGMPAHEFTPLPTFRVECQQAWTYSIELQAEDADEASELAFDRVHAQQVDPVGDDFDVYQVTEITP